MLDQYSTIFIWSCFTLTAIPWKLFILGSINVIVIWLCLVCGLICRQISLGDHLCVQQNAWGQGRWFSDIFIMRWPSSVDRVLKLSLLTNQPRRGQLCGVFILGDPEQRKDWMGGHQGRFDCGPVIGSSWSSSLSLMRRSWYSLILSLQRGSWSS